jgi:hypothetical protein
MTIEKYLLLGDELMKNGRYDEKNLAIAFLKTKREDFSKIYLTGLENGLNMELITGQQPMCYAGLLFRVY